MKDFVRRSRFLIGLAFCGSALAVASCGWPPDASAQAELSSADVIVPAEEYRDDFKFTLYDGWVDTYQLRYNIVIGPSDAEPAGSVTAHQFNPESKWGDAPGGEGPNSDQMNQLEAIAKDKTCEIVETEPEVRMCRVDDNDSEWSPRYLVRDFELESGTATLVTDYYNLDESSELPGNVDVYNHESVEAKFIAADFEPFPIEKAAETWLTSIF